MNPMRVLLCCGVLFATAANVHGQQDSPQDSIEKLIQALSSDNASERDLATKRLVEIGEAAEILLRAHTDESDPEVAVRVRNVLILIRESRWKNAILNPVREVEVGGGAVLSLAFSPDGRTLATGGEWGPIILWEVNTRARLGSLETGTRNIQELAFDPKGGRLASAGYEMEVWDVAGRIVIKDFNEEWCHHVAWSAAGNWLAYQSVAGPQKQHTVVLVEAASLKEVRRVTCPDDFISCLAFTSNESHILCGTNKGNLAEISVSTGEVKTTAVRDAGAGLSSFRVFGDGSLVTRTVAGDVAWDGLTRRAGDKGSGLAISPDGRRIAADREGDLLEWNREGDLLRTCPTGSSGISALLYSPDASRVAAGTWDGDTLLYDGEAVHALRGHRGRARSLTFARGGKFCAIAGRELAFVDADTGSVSVVREPGYLRPGSGPAEVVVESTKELSVWDASKASKTRVIRKKDWGELNLVTHPSPDGEWVATAFNDPDRVGVLLNGSDGKNAIELLESSENSTSICWLNDSRRLAISSFRTESRTHTRYRVQIFDTAGNVLFSREPGDRARVFLHPSGKNLVWIAEKKLHVLDAETLAEVSTEVWEGSDLHFLNDDLAVSFDANNVLLWFVPTWNQVAKFELGYSEQRAVSTDGLTLAVATPFTVKIFRVQADSKKTELQK